MTIGYLDPWGYLWFRVSEFRDFKKIGSDNADKRGCSNRTNALLAKGGKTSKLRPNSKPKTLDKPYTPKTF